MSGAQQYLVHNRGKVAADQQGNCVGVATGLNGLKEHGHGEDSASFFFGGFQGNCPPSGSAFAACVVATFRANRIREIADT